MGLTTQMPVQQTYLSCTRSRKRYRFGKQEISLRQAIRALATPEWNALLTVRAKLSIWLVALLND